ncbi:MAG TPA: energy transducer TonB [Bryocella sp.]|nr:energy transducer TonB [Bryocella sp.]
MHVRGLLLAAVLAFVPLCRSAAQTPSPQADPSVTSASELHPILVDTDNLNGTKGEVVLSIDLDSKGAVTHAKATSGPRDLTGPAVADARMFRYPDRANTSGLVQHIFFRRGADEIRMVTPNYPPTAVGAHASGLVQLVATINQDGHVTDVTVVSGHPLLRNEAENALRQWVFTPVIQNGVAVSCRAIVSFNFDKNRFPN